MANGLQIAASGLAAQESRLDAVASDIANVNTVGYQRSRIAFTELLGGSGGVRASDAGATTAQGALEPSDDPLSVAIDGPGYLQVRTADGRLALTRDGQLRLDGSRSLVVSGGAKVDPPITVPAGVTAEDISVSDDGTVRAAGRTLGKLTLVDVPAPAGLASLSDGLLAPTAASGPATASTAPSFQQGFLEQSNVDLASALTQLLDAQRDFQMASRVIHTQDQLLEIANGIRR
jgi:flagellar basal-body rod protein FlgG